MHLAVSEVDQRSYIALNKWQERRALLTAYRAISRSADGQLYVLIALVAMVWGNDQAALALKTAVLAFGVEVPALLFLSGKHKKNGFSIALLAPTPSGMSWHSRS